MLVGKDAAAQVVAASAAPGARTSGRRTTCSTRRITRLERRGRSSGSGARTGSAYLTAKRSDAVGRAQHRVEGRGRGRDRPAARRRILAGRGRCAGRAPAAAPRSRLRRALDAIDRARGTRDLRASGHYENRRRAMPGPPPERAAGRRRGRSHAVPAAAGSTTRSRSRCRTMRCPRSSVLAGAEAASGRVDADPRPLRHHGRRLRRPEDLSHWDVDVDLPKPIARPGPRGPSTRDVVIVREHGDSRPRRLDPPLLALRDQRWKMTRLAYTTAVVLNGPKPPSQGVTSTASAGSALEVDLGGHDERRRAGQAARGVDGGIRLETEVPDQGRRGDASDGRIGVADADDRVEEARALAGHAVADRAVGWSASIRARAARRRRWSSGPSGQTPSSLPIGAHTEPSPGVVAVVDTTVRLRFLIHPAHKDTAIRSVHCSSDSGVVVQLTVPCRRRNVEVEYRDQRTGVRRAIVAGAGGDAEGGSRETADRARETAPWPTRARAGLAEVRDAVRRHARRTGNVEFRCRS